MDKFIEIKAPIFISYGVEDSGSRMSDLLPIFLDIAHKNNYRISPKLSRGHNFEAINEDGSSNFDDMLWDEVVKEFIDWVETLL